MTWIAGMEAVIVFLCIAYMGPNRYDRRTGGEGNRIARLFLDDPTWLESFLLLFVLTHLLMGAAFFLAWLSARRKRQR